jgi:hypothetical protein
MADFDRARVVDMATAQIGKDTRVKIVFEIPATIEGIEGAIDIMEEVRKDLPPGVDHGGNWAIKAIHSDKCKSKETRSMDDCSCESLICECIQISTMDEAILRSTGGYDMEVDLGGEGTDFN